MNDEYRIKELCRERGIRMGELARRVGYAQASSLSQALDKGIPSNRLIDIANVLNVSVPELFKVHQQSITCPHCGKVITIKTEE
jgi:lambda repressor-like predicted transcriptional regulator